MFSFISYAIQSFSKYHYKTLKVLMIIQKCVNIFEIVSNENYRFEIFEYLLVVKDNVWSPNMVRWNMKHVDAPIFFGIPLQFIVIPILEGTHGKKKREKI